MRRWFWGILPALVLAAWLGWPDSESTSAEAEAEAKAGSPLTERQGKEGARGLRFGKPDDDAGTVEGSTPLALLRSAACWSDCGAPCADLDEEGAPVCSAVCEDDEGCGEGERCLPTEATILDVQRTPRCQKSHCESDEDCLPDWTCLSLAHRTVISVCSRAGNRSVGEPCADDDYDPVGLCEKGLLCIYDVCTEIRDCEIDSDCSIGTRCAFASNGSFCSPGCVDDNGCPTGTECLEVSPGAKKLCLNRENFGCTFGGCEAPLECVAYNDSSAARITACQRPCNSHSDCSESEVCGSQATLGEETHCYPRCDTPSDCEEGWLCTRNAIVADGEDVTACYRDTVKELREFFDSFESSEGGSSSL